MPSGEVSPVSEEGDELSVTPTTLAIHTNTLQFRKHLGIVLFGIYKHSV